MGGANMRRAECPRGGWYPGGDCPGTLRHCWKGRSAYSQGRFEEPLHCLDTILSETSLAGGSATRRVQADILDVLSLE